VAGFYRQHGASISRRFDALQKLSGNELRLRLSRAIARPQRRALLAAEDFRFLMHDERLGMALPSRNRHFEEACRRESDWLGAAYFASINSRWLQFGFWIVRASVSGVPWREWLALGLCRTVWPVYLRLTNAGLTILKGFLGTAFRGTLSDSLRVAHVINRLRMWARVGK
jgi:hypothetical protein